MEFISGPVRHHSAKLPPVAGTRRIPSLLKYKSLSLLAQIKSLGFTSEMEDYDQRKLSIFNQLNFFQLITGVLIPLIGLFNSRPLSVSAFMVACLPAVVSLLVLYLNKRRLHEYGIAAYFLLYPFVTCIVYMYGMNLGIGLFFILYGILSVFFLRDTGYMLFSLFFSLVSFFLLTVVIEHYTYDLQETNYNLYLFNQGLAITFVFFGLFLIKKENTKYQLRLLSRNEMLMEKNEQILKQAAKIEEDTALLKKQADELGEINTVKNKMFSIISHDLKAPIYALRNHFLNVQQKNMSVLELKRSVPEVLKDLNYTVGLMDNLLQWAKTQMQAGVVRLQAVDIRQTVQEILQLLNLQARAKQITIENNTEAGIYALADKDMISLVLRNLISNAIKFTPEHGNISIGLHEHHSFIEVYVRDSGAGISTEAISEISSNNFYTTKGTTGESGTGLGLMLCREFLLRNNSQLHIESEPGEGTTFSFSLSRSA